MNTAAYIVDTKFGRLSLTPTSADHIYATTNPGGGRADQLLPWTIRGRKVNFITAHVYRHADGKWRVGGETADTRIGLYADLSAFAKKLVIPAIEEAVNTFAQDGGALRRAEKERLTTLIERLSVKRDELSAEIRTITDAIAEAIDKRDALTPAKKR